MNIARHLQRTADAMERLLQGQRAEVETEPSERVKALAVDQRNYVAAIKAYREQTGLGLREARLVVDRLARASRGAA